MIINCPSCTTRFNLDPALLGVEGRKVRCTSCGHTWIQPPPQQVPPEMAALLSGRQPDPTDLGIETERRPERRRVGLMVGWIALAAIVVVILGGGIFAKQEITSYWPEAESLYMLLGLEADMPGAGLLLRNVTSARGEDDGIATLVVRGEVVNISDEIQDVPGLRAILRDANENDIQQWSVAAQERRLLPGESTSFESSLKNPPEDAARLSITFAAEP